MSNNQIVIGSRVILKGEPYFPMTVVGIVDLNNVLCEWVLAGGNRSREQYPVAALEILIEKNDDGDDGPGFLFV